MTAREWFRTYQVDGRAIVWEGSRTGRSGRPRKVPSSPDRPINLTSWLIRMGGQILLIMDDDYPIKRVVADDEIIEVGRMGRICAPDFN